MACPDCDASIHGAVTDTESDYKRPSYCHGCGKPYPWTQRSLEAARELIGDELADDELTEFLKNLDDIAKKTPREAVGTERNRKMIAKLSAGAVSALRDIAVNIVSSGAVEKMFGG